MSNIQKRNSCKNCRKRTEGVKVYCSDECSMEGRSKRAIKYWKENRSRLMKEVIKNR